MNELIPREIGGEVAIFDPTKTQRINAQADAVIEYAKVVKDWPLLERAVDAKIKEQAEFVAWWEKVVSPEHGAGRGHKKVQVRGPFSDVGINKQTVARWRQSLQDTDKYRAKLYGAAYQAAMLEEGAEHFRTQFTGENEWYTPPQYIEAARIVLGHIDLDPATSDKAQAWIQATRCFTKSDDGLKHEWGGRVWLNPPFAQPLIAHFIDKLVEEVRANRVSAAVMLTHNYTDTAWFHKAAASANGLCFTRGRIKFVDSAGEVAQPTQGQVFYYFGDGGDLFAQVFDEFGWVVL